MKYNQLKQLLSFSIDFKQALLNQLKSTWNLSTVEPIYIIDFNDQLNNKRTINFDNCLSDEIYSFNLFNDLSLLKYHYYLNYDVYNGIICDYYQFNRDFLHDNINVNNFNFFTIHYKIRSENLNEIFITEFVNQLFIIINQILHQLNKQYSNTVANFKKVNYILQSRLKYDYPLLKFNDAINEYLLTHEGCLLFNDHKDFYSENSSNLEDVDDGLILKGFVYINNQIINTNLLLANLYVVTNQIKEEKYRKYIKDSNILIINLNLSYLIMYILKLNDIKYVNLSNVND